MKDQLRTTLIGLALLLVTISSMTAFYVWDPVLARAMRNASFDQFQRWHPRPYGDHPVRVAALDEESLDRLGQWPWPRTLLAELVDKLRSRGAAAITFDVMFAEPDRTSPTNIAQTWRVPNRTREMIRTLPDHDRIFADAIQGGGVVIGHAGEYAAQPGELPPTPAGIIVRGENPAPYLRQFNSSVRAIPLLEQAADGYGAVNFIPDLDGVVRRVPVLINIGDTLYPSLAMEALRVGQQAGGYRVRTREPPAAGTVSVRTGQITVPTTPNGEAWVYFSEPTQQRTIPIWKLLEGEVPPEEIAGKIFLIGATAQGLLDLRFSPMGGVIPGVEAHAQFLEQQLAGMPLQRPDWALTLEIMVLIVGSLLVGLTTLLTRTVLAVLLWIFALLGLSYFCWQMFTTRLLLLDPLIPILSMALSFIICEIIKHQASEKHEEMVRDAFAHYVSPNLVEHLISHPGALEIGGHRRTCSFIFTDLAGFTPLMESMDPADAIELLNQYLDDMIKITFDHEGTLDRIIGDALAIMFSAPVQQADHADRAIRCALALDRYATAFHRKKIEEGIPFGMTRIGVNSGEVIIGNFGGSAMFDYRALGDAINTAARLESVNKQLGTHMCISELTLQACTEPVEVVLRPVGRLVLKGKSRPLKVFEPRPDMEGEDAEYMAAYERMTAGDRAARELFRALHAQRPDDGLVAMHLDRLEEDQLGDFMIMKEK